MPVMDGALKPNRALDEAQVVAQLPGLNDLACDGRQLWMSLNGRIDFDDQVQQTRQQISELELSLPLRLHTAAAR